MTDTCNWLPMGLVGKGHECGQPCVQEFKFPLRKGAQQLDCHRCQEHKLDDLFIFKLQRAQR